MAKPNFRDQVVESLIEQMERGTASWQKPWEPGKVREPAFNPTTGNAYSGINQIWLESKGYADPRWVTYRQAQANGYQVRKGESGTKIEYWQWADRQPMKDGAGKPVLGIDGKQRYQEVKLDRPKVFHAVVFNGSQIDGLEPYVGMAPDFNPVERAEQALSQLGVPIHHDQRDRAFYQPGTDEIHLPPKGWFKSQYEYYATALHEGGHATGHSSRMARDGGPFGSESYAREELRAEIASFMLTTELGLGHYPERHASYVGSWMKAIKDDRNVLFTAARDAENIRTWIMEPEKRLALTPVKAKEQTQELEQQEMNQPQIATMEQKAAVDPVPNMRVKDIKNDWMLYAAEMAGLPDAKEMNDVERDFSGIDAWTHYIDNQDTRNNVEERNKKTEEKLLVMAGRSVKHAELLSVLFDTHEAQAGENFIDASKWYIPTDRRTTAIAKEIGVKPADYIAEKLVAQNQKARAEQNAKPLEIEEIRTSWVEVAGREAGISYPTFNAYLQKTFSATNWNETGASESAAYSIRDVVDRQSRAHRELASVMWDTYAPDKVKRPDYYIPPDSRTNEVIRALGTDPEKSLLLKAGVQRPGEIDLKEIFKPVKDISAEDIKANWLLHVAQSEGMTDAKDLGEVFGAFHRVDAWTHYIDNQDQATKAVERNKKTEEKLLTLAGRSVKHAELLSVLFDTHERQAGEFFIDASKWYVPADQRKYPAIQALRADPVKSLLNASVAQQPRYEVETGEKGKSVFFDGIVAAVKEFVSRHDNGMNSIHRHDGAEITTVLGHDWYNDGSNHRYWYMTAEVKNLHQEHRDRKLSPERQPIEISGKEVEKSLDREVGRIQTQKAEMADTLEKDKIRAARAQEKGAVMEKTDRKRVFLNVPYSDKNEAKEAGAKWDRRGKAWFVPEGTDMKPFVKWQEKVEDTQTKIDPQQEFAMACREQGLIIEGLPSMDGKWHRVAVDGDAKGRTNGSYRGFLEGVPAGQIMNYKKAAEPVKWVSTGTKIDPEELERIKASSAARKAEQEQELRFEQQKTAKRAYAVFKNAIEATNDHPYLQKKQVSAETLRIDREGNLVVPMANEKGFIENVQTIKADGTKMYLKGGRKAGLMHIIPGKKDSPLIIAEGYATAKSLHAATGFTTVVAFDGGNLPVVAESLRKENPARPFVIASDDDHMQVEKMGFNPGLKAAERAAERSNAPILKPALTANEKQRGLTDFNDLQVARGFDQFRKDVMKQLAALGVTATQKQVAQLTPQHKAVSQSSQMTV
ncbi:zincin-like metallopeptidase domain-containing protein [Thalassospira sp.]|uniref:zincin-like metallopeptidase domain-containing protein n=1 Tax=Thalassospira sp. TaxID=1912094 RepID=UPI00273305E9|nr:zincin-like metallopeptidase domain-containing protein [Thalassospira sp.]MDP2699924.1 zincin-like metallopeptidase domain-containing protein [Thalassospira sp.]